MHPGKLALTVLGLVTLALAHCGGQTTGGVEPGQQGVVLDADAGPHLPSGLPATCSLARGPGSYVAYNDAGVAPPAGGCRQDSDCAARSGPTNGRCDFPSGNGSNLVGTCTYDDCQSDAACGSGFACYCRTSDRPSAANICIEADCKKDADCASGICALSTDRSSCDRPISYHCRASADECAQDADCKAQSFGNCQFSKMKGHFACNYSVCSG